MKKVILILLIGIFVIVSMAIIYDSYFSPLARNADFNFQQIKKVKIGMSKIEVIRIMKKPTWVNQNTSIDYGTETNFTYDVHPGSSELCSITLDSTFRVKEIHVIQE
jgi:cell division protein YceG involved in septum cleavage